MQSVLVTGGSGYIGSHTSLVLLENGYEVYVYDSNINSSHKSLNNVRSVFLKNNKIKKNKLHYIKGDIRDESSLDRLFKVAKDKGQPIKNVIHFAGLKYVSDSMVNSLEYWDVNVKGTINLIEVMKKNNCNTIVFSSSASVYGNSITTLINEKSKVQPINPYGKTKAKVESFLTDIFNKSSDIWKIAILRYFNPIGAHPSGTIGEDPRGFNNNLFPRICEIAFHKNGKLQIYGDDWPTKDGTPIRDYLHVMDVAEGHLKMLEKLINEPPQISTLNLGRGFGISTLELIKVFQEINNVFIPFEYSERRLGDVAQLIADNSLLLDTLKWKPERNLEEMCIDGWKWKNLNPLGY